MSLRAEHGYNFEVTAANLIQSRKGTFGFQLGLQSPEGETDFTIWLTPANRQNILDSFKALGLDATSEDFRSKSYLENQLPIKAVGLTVYGWLKDEEYKGETSTKVSWIGKPQAGKEALAGEVANFFAAAFGDGAPADNADPDLGF